MKPIPKNKKMKKLNIRTKLAENEDTKLIAVDAFTIFEVVGYKFFSHHSVDNSYENLPDRWKVSEYSTGMAVTYNDFEYEDGAIETAKKILEKHKDLKKTIKQALKEYGVANKKGDLMQNCENCKHEYEPKEEVKISIAEFSNILPLVLPKMYEKLKNDGAFYCFTSWTEMPDWLLRFQQYFKLERRIYDLS